MQPRPSPRERAGLTETPFLLLEKNSMTQSFMIMALGISIGYSILLTLWLVTSGRIAKLAKKEGAETVMFVNDKGDLVVADTETGKRLEQFRHSLHEPHPTEIRFDNLGEPVLYDKDAGIPIVEHKKPLDKEYRVPVPNSDRYIAASVIYFWRYSGSKSCCHWSLGSHVVSRRS